VELAGYRVLAEQAPATLGGSAVGADVHHRLQLHVVVEAAFLQTFRPDGPQVLQHPGPAAKLAASLSSEGPAIGKQRGSLAPQTLVDVVAIDALQILDGVMVRQSPCFESEAGHAARSGGGGLDFRRDRGRDGIPAWQLAGEMEPGRVGVRPGLVGNAGRRVGRQARADKARFVHVRVPGPSAIVIRHIERLVPVEPADLPDAVLLDVLVLEGAFAPEGTLPQLARQDDVPPGSPGGATVLREGHDRHQLQVLVQLPRRETPAAIAEGVEVFTDTVTPVVHAIQTHLDRRTGREQISGVVPQCLIDVIAIDTLQILERVEVLEPRAAQLELLHPCGDLLHALRAGSRMRGGGLQ
jgi:hypothetical protein